MQFFHSIGWGGAHVTFGFTKVLNCYLFAGTIIMIIKKKDEIDYLSFWPRARSYAIF